LDVVPKMIQPILAWEEDLWPVFDRLKAAMDRQEQARVAGELDEFIAQWTGLFKDLENLTYTIYMRNEMDEVKMTYVYLSWKASRGINSWMPDRDLPLKWRLANWCPVPVPQADAIAAIKAKHEHWAWQNKENAKLLKAEQRRIQKDKERAEKAKQAAKEPKKAVKARKKAS
jgi:hypothetical protein